MCPGAYVWDAKLTSQKKVFFPHSNMAGNRNRVYWNDSKTTVRNRLGLEDDEDSSKFKVGMLLILSSYISID